MLFLSEFLLISIQHKSGLKKTGAKKKDIQDLNTTKKNTSQKNLCFFWCNQVTKHCCSFSTAWRYLRVPKAWSKGRSQRNAVGTPNGLFYHRSQAFLQSWVFLVDAFLRGKTGRVFGELSCFFQRITEDRFLCCLFFDLIHIQTQRNKSFFDEVHHQMKPCSRFQRHLNKLHTQPCDQGPCRSGPATRGEADVRFVSICCMRCQVATAKSLKKSYGYASLWPGTINTYCLRKVSTLALSRVFIHASKILKFLRRLSIYPHIHLLIYTVYHSIY